VTTGGGTGSHPGDGKIGTVEGGEHQTDHVPPVTPLGDPASESPVGQVRLDAERTAGRHRSTELCQQDPASGDVDATGRGAGLEQLVAHTNRLTEKRPDLAGR
jgi:hypothetical protein